MKPGYYVCDNDDDAAEVESMFEVEPVAAFEPSNYIEDDAGVGYEEGTKSGTYDDAGVTNYEGETASGSYDDAGVGYEGGTKSGNYDDAGVGNYEGGTNSGNYDDAQGLLLLVFSLFADSLFDRCVGIIE
jgi:hypothetical protein